MPKHEDFRDTREARIGELTDSMEKNLRISRDKAHKAAVQRMDKAMPLVVREREGQGRSRVTEINLK